MHSIRSYIETRVVWGTALILVTVSVTLALTIRGTDTREFDEALETKARTLATLVLQDEHGIEVEFAGQYMPEFEQEEDAQYFQFRLLDGTVIERSDTLGNRDLPFLENPERSARFRNMHLPDGRRGRLVQIPLVPRMDADTAHDEADDPPSSPLQHNTLDPHIVVLSVARSREALDTLLLSVYLLLAGVTGLVTILVSLLVRRALARGFAPVDEMNQQIRDLDAESLDRKIQIVHAPTELEMVLHALNAFIGRLRTAFEREQRFTNDAAHELRTPIAEFRAACEVGAHWADDPKLARRRFEDLCGSAKSMESTIQNLLELCRLDQGTVVPTLAPTVLVDVISGCWDPLQKEAAQRSLVFQNRVDTSLMLNTDSNRLASIIQNLLDNAVSYSTPDTTIRCTSQITNGGTTLAICNDTNCLQPDEMDHIFDRFWRARNEADERSHSGLGLAIVSALTDVLGIRILVDLTKDHAFTVTLVFPRESVLPDNTR